MLTSEVPYRYIMFSARVLRPVFRYSVLLLSIISCVCILHPTSRTCITHALHICICATPDRYHLYLRDFLHTNSPTFAFQTFTSMLKQSLICSQLPDGKHTRVTATKHPIDNSRFDRPVGRVIPSALRPRTCFCVRLLLADAFLAWGPGPLTVASQGS